MAMAWNVVKDDHVFVGEDKELRGVIFEDHEQTTVMDMTGVPLIWSLRKRDNSAEPALIEKSTEDSPPGIVVEGTFNADPLVNTQEVVILLHDTDSWDETVSPPVRLRQRKYRHALKRMNDGAETVLAWGSFQFLMATTRR